MREKRWENNVICDRCGYHNHKRFVDDYGTCHLCGKVLDEKVKFKREMHQRLHLWAKRKGKNHE